MVKEYEARVAALQESLDESQDSRKQLKDDVQELNDKLVNLEEELFESKNI